MSNIIYTKGITSPVKLGKSSELIPRKQEFDLFFSLYLTDEHTKSPDTYPLCIALHPSSKGGAPLSLFSLITRQLFNLQ